MVSIRDAVTLFFLLPHVVTVATRLTRPATPIHVRLAESSAPHAQDVGDVAIRTHAIETLKASLLAKTLSRKRVNNVLACLGKMLRYANEIEILEVVPRIMLLEIAPQKFDFLTFEESSRLIEAMKDDAERWPPRKRVSGRARSSP